MGGNAFGTTARRLTTPELDALTAHCAAALAGHFAAIARPRHLLDKGGHGDLDLVCAWDGIGFEGLKGKEGGEVGGDGGDGEDGNDGEDGEDGQDGEVGEVAEVVAIASGAKSELHSWADNVARAAGATKWERNGSLISLAIPAAAIDAASKPGPVDLILVPPAAHSFTSTLVSYSVQGTMIAQLLRVLSPSLTLHERSLGLRHRVFPARPPVDIFLTADADDFMAFFGWDLAAWEARTFADEREMWAWLADVDEGSRAAAALTRLLRSNGARVSANRPTALDALKVYLETTKWARVAAEEQARRARDSGVAPAEPAPPVVTPARAALPFTLTPKPLDRQARAALEHWVGTAGVAEFERLVVVRAADARAVWDAQEARRVRKLVAEHAPAEHVPAEQAPPEQAPAEQAPAEQPTVQRPVGHAPSDEQLEHAQDKVEPESSATKAESTSSPRVVL